MVPGLRHISGILLVMELIRVIRLPSGAIGVGTNLTNINLKLQASASTPVRIDSDGSGPEWTGVELSEKS